MKPIWLIITGMLISITACEAQNKNHMKELDTSTVSELDIDRYLGTWYEIARYPHRFEKDLQGVTATYSYREDGKIKVVNQGYKGSLSGEKTQAIGKAKINKKGGPGKLKVSFFWIFYADYYVMELDPDYQWALIGSSSDKYLWILARTPQLPDTTYQQILEKARERGYDLTNLQKVDQAKNQ